MKINDNLVQLSDKLLSYVDENNSFHRDVKKIIQGNIDLENVELKNIYNILANQIEKEDTTNYSFNLVNSKNDIESLITDVRNKRKVSNVNNNDCVITNPYKEIVLTSNILLTMPDDYDNFEFDLKGELILDEEQTNWYDHPTPLDIDDSANEILYGIKNLSDALKYETDEKVVVILSVSTTHNSINKISKQYIQQKLKKLNIDNLILYVFTEDDCIDLINIIDKENINLKETFGVSGFYGRHYSFLKAIVPMYQKVFDTSVKATFKFDLDQVFPQKELKEVTGHYAFERFIDNRIGCTGVDYKGNSIKLSMFAGSLVNENDIQKDLFYPDVTKPNDNPNIEEMVFNSKRPQYISTIAEMSKQYKDKNEASQRIHITGGMNGILLDDLVKYRPFTPSFITRAEDQAYLLSVFNKEIDSEYLRVLHLDKFVMRHDKQAFLSDKLECFAIPKSVGDFERTLLYSHYAYDILGNGDEIKEYFMPFTGEFIRKNPALTVTMRMISKLLLLNEEDGNIFINSFNKRIANIINKINSGELKAMYNKEERAYNEYYDFILNNKDKEKTEEIKNVFLKTRGN